jgi:exonuclease 3'-5' domain-containing protein 1
MSDTIDTVDLVHKLIEDIENSQPCPPFIFMDLKGVNLSRHGSIVIMQVLVPPVRQVHLVDVLTH